MVETLLNSKWALEPSFHDRMALIVMQRLAAGKTAVMIEEDRPDPYFVSIISAASAGRSSSRNQEDEGRVVVLPIMGTMSRYGDFCSYGTEDYASWIIEANNDPTISAIVLEINSPGGQVDGTEALGEVIRTSQKPVVAWVAGMAASAAYWIASQASHIMMESKTSSEVGSIGVLAMHVDASEAYQKEGYKVTIVRATGSEDKALFNSIEPLSEAVLNETKAVLSVIRKEFEATVKAGRPEIDENVFTGKMYIGRDAIKLGMADSIGFLGDAIAKAAKLAKQAA